MKKALLIIVIAAILVASVLYLYPGLLFPDKYAGMERQFFHCAEGDTACLERAKEYRDNCVNSTFTVEGDNLTMHVNISRMGGECEYGEEFDETDYSVNCTVPIGDECEGSLFDYIVSPPGGGGGGGSGGWEIPGLPGTPEFDCSLTDTDCKAQSVEHIMNCIPAKITDDDERWASGYWTKYFTVSKDSESCYFHAEILNAVDIPPEIPEDIVGMSMDCTIPLSLFPISDIREEWCEGPLYEYLVD